jgi:NMT1-like family
MKSRLTGASVLILVVTALATITSAADLGLITGGEKGTYYQFGLNLQKLLQLGGTNLAVYTSKGSIENVYAVYQRPATQLGIVQSDVLAFVARVQSDPVLKRIAKKTRMVFPLYNEEIHVLGRRGITDFDDLADRRVAIGREGSGTYLTARLLFKVSDVAPKEMVPIDTEEALADRRHVLCGRIPREAVHRAGHRQRRLRPDPNHQQEHHRVLSAIGDTGWYLLVAIECIEHGGGQGRTCVLRLPRKGLRECWAFRPDDLGKARLAGQERPSKVEIGRSRISPEGMGAV